MHLIFFHFVATLNLPTAAHVPANGCAEPDNHNPDAPSRLAANRGRT